MEIETFQCDNEMGYGAPTQLVASYGAKVLLHDACNIPCIHTGGIGLGINGKIGQMEFHKVNVRTRRFCRTIQDYFDLAADMSESSENTRLLGSPVLVSP